MNLFVGYAISIESIIAEINAEKSKGRKPDYQAICAKYGRPNLEDFTEDELEYIENCIGE